MAFWRAQNVDVRHSTFNDVGGNQYTTYKNEFNLGSKENVLNKLEPMNMDGSNRKGCLENTRSDVLTLIINWASSSTSTQSTLWLHGPAGSGKSTISTTLADRFRKLKQLGAFLFFDRDVTERSDPFLVARTLAYQIGSFHPDIGVLIASAVENSQQVLVSPISSQFQELLIEPLSSVPIKTQIVLVLDGLDECGTNADRKTLLDVLAEKSAHLPSGFRLVITSRPDSDMRFAFELRPHVKMLELDLTSTASNKDISTYFRHRMNIIQKKNSYLGAGWPGKKKIRALTGRAFGLFVWASIACNFIDAHDPRKRLDIILKGSKAPTAEAELDNLYRTALGFTGVWDDEDFIADFKAIIGMVLVLRNPLTSTAIDKLIAIPDGRPSDQTIKKFSCIMSLIPTVRFIHPSVADFFMDRSRCGRDIWFFKRTFHERQLAVVCLQRLDQFLHHGMSLLPPLNGGENQIPEDVAYACVFWVDHVCTIKDDWRFVEKLLDTIINEHILHWFEAMSLLKRFSLTIILLDRLSDWIRRRFFLRTRRILLKRVRHWWGFSQEYRRYIQENPMLAYSDELHREFPITQVQEPLVSQPPALSILDLVSPSYAVDTSSHPNFLSPSSSPLTSPFDGISEAEPSVSHPASPDFVRPGRRLSRSSLSLPSRRSSRNTSKSSGSSLYTHLTDPVSLSSSSVFSVASSHEPRTRPTSRPASPNNTGANPPERSKSWNSTWNTTQHEALLHTSSNLALSVLGSIGPGSGEGDDDDRRDDEKGKVTELEREEDEDTMHQVRGKLYALGLQNQWKERGIGILKLNVRRIQADMQPYETVMRKEGVYTLLLNVTLSSVMQCSVSTDPRYFGFSVIEGGATTHYKLKVSSAKIAQELLEEINSNIPS